MQLSRASLLTASSLVFLAFAAGCGSTVDSPSGASSGAGGATGSSGPGSPASSSSSGDFDAGGMVTTIDGQIGPITAAPGMENVQCVTINLKNAEGAFVRRFRADLGSGSHHMIVYTSNKTVEQPVPQDCKSFSGLLGGEHPIFIAQQAHAELVFPSDDNGTPVGFEIQPNQMVKVEMHYIDTTPGPLQVTGKFSMDTVPLSTKVTKSDLAFWGTALINIPPNSMYSTGVKFQTALPNTRTFALTTHQHQLGTEMQVWYAKSANDASKMQVADGKNWSDPPLELFNPPLAFPGSGGQQGLAYQCTWNNNTPNTVTFGEGFNNEMCFLWQYYFPSQGFQICTDLGCKMTP